MSCRCRSGECDPECDGPELRAEIERLEALLKAKTTPGYELLGSTIEKLSARIDAKDAEIERLKQDWPSIEQLRVEEEFWRKKAAALRARNERLEAALTNIQRRAWPHADDTDADRKRNLFHIEAEARAALARKEG